MFISKILRGSDNFLAIKYFPDMKILLWHFHRRLIFIIWTFTYLLQNKGASHFFVLEIHNL